jgi:pimeloyl-ACP methyl ester carboxylesterase
MSSPRRGEAPRLALSLAVLAAVTGCGTPVTVRRVDPRTVHRELTRNVLSAAVLSGATRTVLGEWDLVERFEDAPEEALAELHALVSAGGARADEVFALAELSFAHAEDVGSRAHYLAAAVYAWAFLFPNGAASPPDPFDPRLRTAADLYNRGITSGLASEDGEEVDLRSGTHALPFGELVVELDEAGLRWGDRKLVDFVPVAELEVRGLRERYRRTGIGAPLAAHTISAVPGQGFRDFVGKTAKVPVTALLRIEDARRRLATGRLHARLEIYDAYDARAVTIEGREVPLEVEPTACLAYTLSDSNVWEWELKGFFAGDFLKGFFVGNPDDGRLANLLFVHPYRPGRIPVVLVHGTASSPGRWADMLNTLENDPEIRGRYQFWFFFYDTGKPVVFSADTLRSSLENVIAGLDPEGRDPALRRMVIIGHSQGGLLAKMTAVETGDRLWREMTSKSLDDMLLRKNTRDLLRKSFFVSPLPCVARVVFLATPHRGSYLAGSWIAHQVAGLVTLPARLVDVSAELLTGNPGAIPLTAAGGLLSSVHNMTPGSPFVKGLASLSLAPGVAKHSIVAIDEDGPPEDGDDGVVEYSSAHLEETDSEILVRSGHSVQSHPLAIAEVRRILRLHAAGHDGEKKSPAREEEGPPPPEEVIERAVGGGATP